MASHANGPGTTGENWDTLGGSDPGGREDEISDPATA